MAIHTGDTMTQNPARPATRPANVYFFATCVIDQFHPDAGLDAIALLEREGVRVHFPENQTCCGQPAYTSGFHEEARAVAASQLALFPEDWPVVVPSGSCAGMMKHHYTSLFSEDPVRKAHAQKLAGRIYEFTQFLVEVLEFEPVDQGAECTVVLHTSCSARREMGVHLTGKKLLDALKNVDVAHQDHESECCGFGGTFALKQPELSGAMVEDKVAALKATGAQQVISADCGCLMNIMGHANWKDKQEGKTQPSLAGEHIARFLLRRTGGAK
jgi:L-lactate dehydrogenase complex protein LldE